MSSLTPSKLKVTELREELKKRGADYKGNKAQLVKKLEKALRAEQGADVSISSEGDVFLNASQNSSILEDSTQESPTKSEMASPTKKVLTAETGEVVPDPVQATTEVVQPEPEDTEHVKETEKAEISQSELDKEGDDDAQVAEKPEVEQDQIAREAQPEAMREETLPPKQEVNVDETSLKPEAEAAVEESDPVKQEEDEPKMEVENGSAPEAQQNEVQAPTDEPKAENFSDGDFQVTDSVGDDGDAPEADQVMAEADRRQDRKRRHSRSASRSRSRSRQSRSKEGSRSRSRDRRRRSRSRDRRSRSGDRRRHRSRSPLDAEKAAVEMESDDWLKCTNVVLDRYNSDLNLKVSKTGFKGNPLTNEGFAFMWAGARATYGVASGKMAFEVKVLEHLSVSHLPSDETASHVVRVGWSTNNCSMQLGEDASSYGYGGTAKKSTNCVFEDYGESFGSGDVITSYLDFGDDNFTISFSKNGVHLGDAFTCSKDELHGEALFPHVLTKNCEFETNFGQRTKAVEPAAPSVANGDAEVKAEADEDKKEEPEDQVNSMETEQKSEVKEESAKQDEECVEIPSVIEPFFPLRDGFSWLNDVDVEQRIRGSEPPAKKEECEMLMMCGLPGAGKTVWAKKEATENPDKKFNVLGTNNIIDKMRVMGLPRRRNYTGRWDVLIDKSTKCLNRLLELAARKKRNYILDQTNVYPSAQRRKMRPFEGFLRRAVVLIPEDAEYKDRCQKRESEEGKDVPDTAVLEMKANFKLPEEGSLFDSVQFVELNAEEAEALVKKYNKEGRDALPPEQKRYRDNRDYGNRDRYRGGRGGWDRNRDRHGGGGGWVDRRGGGGGGRYDDRRGHRGWGDRRGGGGGGGGGGYMGYSREDRNRFQRGDRRERRDNFGRDRDGGRQWGQQNWGNQGNRWGGNQGKWNNQGGYGGGQGGGGGWYGNQGGGGQNWGNFNQQGGQWGGNNWQGSGGYQGSYHGSGGGNWQGGSGSYGQQNNYNQQWGSQQQYGGGSGQGGWYGQNQGHK